MIPPDVELDTIEEFQEKLKELNTYDKLKAINLVLSRKNIPNCSNFSNEFISKSTGVPVEEVERIDNSGIRPLQQIFEVEDDCSGCVKNCRQGWRISLPWTGSHLVPRTFLPEKAQCKIEDRNDGSAGFYGSMSSSYSWIWKPLESQTFMIYYRKSANEIRVYAPQYENISDRFLIAKSESEFQRMVLFYRYIAIGTNETSSLNFGHLANNDPIIDIIKSNNWMTTPSEFWNNKISIMDQTIASLSNVPRQEALKIVMESFKEEIDQCGSVSEFMELYFPKINILALSAMCQMGKQPA